MFVYDSGAGPVGIIAAGALTGILTLIAGQVIFATVRSPLIRMSIAVLFAAPAAFAYWYLHLQGLSRDPWHRRTHYAVRDLAADLRRNRFDCRWCDRLDADGNADARSVGAGKRRETGSAVGPGRRADKGNGHPPVSEVGVNRALPDARS
jgi:hypothetical protein